MRVLYVSDVYFPRINGVSTSIQTFRRELAALAHDSALVAPRYPAPYADDDPGIVRVPARYVPLDPEDRAMRWRALLAAGRALAGREFDLVHIQTPFLAHYAGLRFARERGIPAVATYHTLFEEYLFHYARLAPRAAMRALARRFSRSQCNQLDAVVVPSTAMREALERYGVTTRIEIVPTGIRLQEFAGGDGARFRARHGIAPGRPLALFVGRVAFEKNIGFLLRAHVRVLREVPDALLVVCGEGPAARALAREAAALDLGERVRFVGYLDRATELPDCYRAADAFVFASRTETQGLVLLEAMALGVPVVSTAVMGTRDVVGPGRGALVPADDEAAFAAAVVCVLRDRRLRDRLAEEAVEYAREWSAPGTAWRMAAVYRAAVAAGREEVRNRRNAAPAREPRDA